MMEKDTKRYKIRKTEPRNRILVT